MLGLVLGLVLGLARPRPCGAMSGLAWTVRVLEVELGGGVKANLWVRVSLMIHIALHGPSPTASPRP